MAEPEAPRIYVDTCVYLDLVTQEMTQHPGTGEPRWKSAKTLFDAVNDDRVVLAASALIEAEVLCVPAVREVSSDVIDQIRGWFTAEATLWTEVDRFLAREAVRLAGEWHDRRADETKRLGGADATHLAAAVRLGCNYLMTTDGGFPIGSDIEGVKVRWPEVVWAEHLLDGLDP